MATGVDPGRARLLEFLEQESLQEFTDNFIKEGVIYTDLIDLKDHEIERLVPAPVPRKRLVRQLATMGRRVKAEVKSPPPSITNVSETKVQASTTTVIHSSGPVAFGPGAQAITSVHYHTALPTSDARAPFAKPAPSFVPPEAHASEVHQLTQQMHQMAAVVQRIDTNAARAADHSARAADQIELHRAAADPRSNPPPPPSYE